MRNETLFREACKLFSKGFTTMEVTDTLFDTYISEGLPRNEIVKTIKSAERKAGGNNRHQYATQPTMPASTPVIYPGSKAVKFWDHCKRLVVKEPMWYHAVAMTYLLRRGFNISHLCQEDIVRIAPPPRIGNINYTKITAGEIKDYCLVVPMFDWDGKHQSFQLKSIKGTNPKSKSPFGYSASGLVLSSHYCMHRVITKQIKTLFVVEGIPDTFKMIMHCYSKFAPFNTSWAVVGILSGSSSWFERVTLDGVHVVLIPHYDQAGSQYMGKLFDILTKRHVACEIKTLFKKKEKMNE